MILKLPPEIFHHIGEYLSLTDLISAGGTCRLLRGYLISHIWSSVAILNCPTSENAVKDVKMGGLLSIDCDEVVQNPSYIGWQYIRTLYVSVGLELLSGADGINIDPHRRIGHLASLISCSLDRARFKQLHIETTSTAAFDPLFQSTALTRLIETKMLKSTAIACHLNLRRQQKLDRAALDIVNHATMISIVVGHENEDFKVLPQQADMLTVYGQNVTCINVQNLFDQCYNHHCRSLTIKRTQSLWMSNIKGVDRLEIISSCLRCHKFSGDVRQLIVKDSRLDKVLLPQLEVLEMDLSSKIHIIKHPPRLEQIIYGGGEPTRTSDFNFYRARVVKIMFQMPQRPDNNTIVLCNLFTALVANTAMQVLYIRHAIFDTCNSAKQWVEVFNALPRLKQVFVVFDNWSQASHISRVTGLFGDRFDEPRRDTTDCILELEIKLFKFRWGIFK